jgi:hypothetical protein
LEGSIAMDDVRKHPDLYTGEEALVYLHLDKLTSDPERTLETLRDNYGLVGQRLGAGKLLYHRRNLDAVVDRVFGVVDADAAAEQVRAQAAQLPVPTTATKPKGQRRGEPQLKLTGVGR